MNVFGQFSCLDAGRAENGEISAQKSGTEMRELWNILRLCMRQIRETVMR